jgi:hypothetical protein
MPSQGKAVLQFILRPPGSIWRAGDSIWRVGWGIWRDANKQLNISPYKTNQPKTKIKQDSFNVIQNQGYILLRIKITKVHSLELTFSLFFFCIYTLYQKVYQNIAQTEMNVLHLDVAARTSWQLSTVFFHLFFSSSLFHSASLTFCQVGVRF